jgi:glycosyltransferase involved in cell wall biosynthesis
LDNVRSELIIYDTGSTDGTVEIAREFTDKVYEIEWRDDFAWARNHTIAKAIGRWYMYVDADEIFVDTDDIIKFFNSGEYRNYKSASYILRDIQRETTSLFRAARLYRLEKDTIFKDKIHENIISKDPAKLLNSIAEHYGYDFASEEDKMKKHERNIKPMLEMFEKENPKKLRTINHIINEYNLGQNREKAKEFFKIGFDIIGENQKNPFYHAFTNKWVDLLFQEKKREELVDYVRNYFSNLTVFEQNTIVLRYFEAVALQQLKRYKESGDAFVKTIELFEKNERGELGSTATLYMPLSLEIIENKPLHLKGAATNYLLAGEFDLAFEWNQKSGRKEEEMYEAFSKYAANALLPDGDREGIVKMYVYGLQHGVESDRYNFIVTALERGIESKRAKIEAAKVLTQSIELADCNTDYMRLQHLRLKHYEGLDHNSEIEYFLDSNKPFEQQYSDVILMAIRQNRDFSTFFENLKITDSKELAIRAAVTNDDIADILSKLLEDGFFAAPQIKFVHMFSLIADVAFNRARNRASSKVSIDRAELAEPLSELFGNAARIRHKYFSMLYRDDIYCDEGIVWLSDRDSATFFAGRAFESRDKGDTAGLLRNLRLALKASPNIKEMIVPIIERVEEQYEQQQAQEPSSAQAELNQLSGEMADVIAGLKSAIYAIINSGDLKKATEILDGYEQLNPDDPEIEVMRKAINRT